MTNQYNNYIPIQDLVSTTDIIEAEETMSESVNPESDTSDITESMSETVGITIT